MWHLTACKISVNLLFLNWIKNDFFFYHISELMLATLIQRYNKKSFHFKNKRLTEILASGAQLDVPSDWRPGGCGFNPRRGWQRSFVEIDREIFSMVILSLPLIQEGQLSVSGKRMCTVLVNHLED